MMQTALVIYKSCLQYYNTICRMHIRIFGAAFIAALFTVVTHVTTVRAFKKKKSIMTPEFITSHKHPNHSLSLFFVCFHITQMRVCVRLCVFVCTSPSVCMWVIMCVKAGQRLLDASGLFSIYGPPTLLQCLTSIIQNTLLHLLLH